MRSWAFARELEPNDDWKLGGASQGSRFALLPSLDIGLLKEAAVKRFGLSRLFLYYSEGSGKFDGI